MSDILNGRTGVRARCKDDPDLDARVLSLDRECRELISALTPEEKKNALGRLDKGELAGYVFGKKFFFNNYFTINRDCLIPRPDTERVVEEAISLLPQNGIFADLCAGCGCIGLSVLDMRRDARGFFTDISEGALECCRKNAAALSLEDNVVGVLRCDMMKSDPLSGRSFDIIVSNPPYLTTSEIEEYPDLAAEPRAALDGGTDGLDFYRRIIRDLSPHLRDGGALVFEIGYAQKDDIERTAAEHGFDCAVKKDYGGNYRVATLRRRKE